MIEAYHVSRSSGLTVLKPREMNSRDRDGSLYGFPAVSMTTTRYHGQLPNISPYPEDADAGTLWYRYTMKFDLDDYDIFEMAATKRDDVTQVRLLLLHRSKSRQTALAAFIRSWDPTCELTEHDRTLYFPHDEANQYLRKNKTFVNVHFTSKVQVVFRDQVLKKGPVFQPRPIEPVPYDTLVVAFRNHQSQVPDDFVTGLENLVITGPPHVPADGSGSASEPEDEAMPKPKAKASSKSRAKTRDEK